MVPDGEALVFQVKSGCRGLQIRLLRHTESQRPVPRLGDLRVGFGARTDRAQHGAGCLAARQQRVDPAFQLDHGEIAFRQILFGWQGLGCIADAADQRLPFQRTKIVIAGDGILRGQRRRGQGNGKQQGQGATQRYGSG